MRVARGRLLRNAAGSLGILVTLAVIAIGLPAVDRAVPAIRPIPTHEPYEVGGGVTVLPPPGAQLDVTRTRPSAQQGTVLFVLGPIRYVIVVAPFDGDLDGAVGRLRRKVVNAQGRLDAGLATATGSGLPGQQGAYATPDRTGRYAVFLAPRLSIEVTVSGSVPLPAPIEASIRSIAYRGRE
ncbi:hypothetical protein [Phytohabitans rumicis]|uniref:Uncharacterized protein n=1 Tax=Phytohabitans rumicis TaxID=1076125 RepID=A0A6V8L6D6_9ACTN|nr:hypothetical protein [Phytohabitans rumicis]GFJ90381.1 hypothetical protein Prum_040230 [Phytohabitans rumicis]